MTEAITIAGAGIGGLTTALTLQQRGIQPLLFDSAEAIRPVGAGIIMAINAMRIYDKLGVRGRKECGGETLLSGIRLGL